MSSDTSREQRRAQRLARYDELRAERPQLFVNPPDAAYEIVFDQAGQNRVADESAAKLRAVGKPEEYGDIGVIYEDSFVIGVRDAVRFRDGRMGPYIRVLGAVAGTGAAVMPVLPDGRIVLIRHFRHDPRSWRWEIPRGFAEPGADGVTTAGRELTEELGVPVGQVELLGRFANGAESDEIFLARLDVPELPAEGTRDAFLEGIDDVRLVTREQLEAMMVAGEMTDSFTLAAYAFAVARGAL
ncbi:NUDIX hydrolase [Actinoplanes sp. NPDC048967]|uniref:NUDIX hydrolase n=1 Tax=Actinoplanes sp. NPDC048967 TaxID=3155269 RepID=UPI0033E68EBC